MQLADQKQSDRDELEPILYAALINSMVQNFWAIFLGSASAAVAAVMTALKTGDVLLWPIAFLIIAIGTARAFQMRPYENRMPGLSFEQAKHLEPRYWAGALLYAAVIGLWCFVVIFNNDDAVANMLCVSVTVGYTAGGAARNYGQPRVIQWHVALACGPMSLALLLHGGFYYIGLAIILVLFFIALKNINLSLHAIFVKALTSSFRESALASQFDTALNNMPHGLCMFRADGRLAVMNHRFSELMALPDDLVKRGATAADIASACVAAGSISAASGDQILSEIEKARIREIVTADPDQTRGRTLSWTFQPMTGGGTVLLLEDITERTNAEARISHLARYDELTALPNRVSFRDEIERLLAQSSHSERLSALLFVDLDQFKQVNDTLGHPCGDRLLCAVANRLREMLRPEDFVARFGGDEFVVFQQNLASPEDAAALARRIVERLSERYRIDNHLVEIGASVGIALTSPDGTSADTLLKNADMALYRAKADGRGTFCFFRDEMAATVEARRILELDLRKALANEEFELFYQPLVNLKSGKITTCEALLRWNHPVRGTVSPVDIIPVAEDMGLIVDLGRWILRRACMECMKWPEGVSVAVNFSPQQFHQRDVLSEIRYALEVSGLPAHRLEIEITESSLLRNTQLTHDILSQLHALGVRISLDDFGTGYSSLSYLHNFPMQKVKIDRSFLEGIDTDRPLTLLRGVARLSADLGMAVVVEGIETNEQLELISADGTVSEGQGYLFSRPVPAVRMRQLLNASHGRRGESPLQLVGSRSIA
ncbi:EAL domain-containing protein [Bradyrhizobium liaoningense]|uniref:putative bifunctional diguanylate cyclase/phosphodiesterase n=1 Tax=Bradyrhizobium TaxID=374 RepID=UPI00140F0EBD|nr:MULTISPECIES: EAL domain-containing protein [Bradyrhizobium]MBR0736257.1 EAL domain-containing protein [Bradyrhizobium liaoningense]QIO31626.1 EAL domain-containing protein [Bradyrhizobium sp. 1(2017)]